MAQYVAAGANRHPAAADWYGETLAYGADRNVAIWNPQVCHYLLPSLCCSQIRGLVILFDPLRLSATVFHAIFKDTGFLLHQIAAFQAAA